MRDTTGDEMSDWKRGDVVRDDSGNLFCYHPLHGWFGLASNQPSALGHHEEEELAEPLILLVRDGRPTTTQGLTAHVRAETLREVGRALEQRPFTGSARAVVRELATVADGGAGAVGIPRPWIAPRRGGYSAVGPTPAVKVPPLGRGAASRPMDALDYREDRPT